MRDIYAAVPSSLQEDMKNEQEAIKGNERVVKLKALVEELKVLQAQLEKESAKAEQGGTTDSADQTDIPEKAKEVKKADESKQPEEAKKAEEVNLRDLARNYEMKRQEAETLKIDFEAFRAEREKAMKKRMVLSMRSTLNRIMEASQKVASEKGFDIVFDCSGATNTGAPFLLYSKNVIDLTDDIQTVLKASEPAATAPAATAPAATAPAATAPAPAVAAPAPSPAPTTKP